MKKNLNGINSKYTNNIPRKIIFSQKKEEEIFELGDPPSEEEGIGAKLVYYAKKSLLERYIKSNEHRYNEEQNLQAIAFLKKIQNASNKSLKMSGHSAIFDKNTSIENFAYQEAHKILNSSCIDVDNGTVNDVSLIKYFQEIEFPSYISKLSTDTYVQIILTIILFLVSIKIQSKQGTNSDKRTEENFKKIENRLTIIEKKLDTAIKNNKIKRG